MPVTELARPDRIFMNAAVAGPAHRKPKFPVKEELPFPPALMVDLGGAAFAADLADHLRDVGFTEGRVFFELGATFIADLLHTIKLYGLGNSSLKGCHKCKT